MAEKPKLINTIEDQNEKDVLNFIDFQKIETHPPIIKRYPEEIISNVSNQEALRFKFVLSNLKAGFWEYMELSNVAFVSDEIFNLLGITEKCNTIDFRYLWKIIHTDDKYTISNLINQITDTNSQIEFDLRITLDNDSSKQIKTLHCIVLIEKSQPDMPIKGIVYDVTEIRRHEEELLKQISKALESDRFKSAFLTNMSHEIRTPMNTILGFTELLNLGDLPVEKKNEFLAIIKNKSKYLLSLIDDIIEESVN
jgi:signal transduction histidine kinase